MRPVAALCVVLLMTLGCAVGGSPSPLPYLFPINTLSAQPGGPAAELTGTLELRPDGCLVVVDGRNPALAWLVGWPEHVTPDVDASGDPLVLVDDGLAVKVGDTVALGGGAYESNSDQSFARSKLDPQVPCEGPIWLAWNVLEVPPT